MPRRLLCLILCCALSACLSEPPRGRVGAPGKGGYYKDDGPGATPPANLAAIPDAVPRDEPIHRGASKPYMALGKSYTPMTAREPFRQRGLASWYGRRYHGKATSSGEPYDMYAMSAAHPTLPLPSYVRVTNLNNRRSVLVRVNDRGPFHDGRIIDLSYTAAWKLDILKGVTPVEVEVVRPGENLPPVADTPVPAASAEPPAGLYLQFAAFASPAAADALATHLRNRYGEQLPGLIQYSNGTLVKVQAGPFASTEAAEQIAQSWLAENGERPFRVRR